MAGSGSSNRDGSTATGEVPGGPEQKSPLTGGPAGEAMRDPQPENLTEPDDTSWGSQPPQYMALYLGQLKADYFAIVEDYVAQADRAVEQYRVLMASNLRWRRSMIIATGMLAAINVCAALNLLNLDIPFGSSANPYKLSIPAVLNAIAALYAGALTVAGNIENLGRKAEKAIGFREARDLLLDQYWDYYFKWYRYAEPYGVSATACVNASRLCKQLIESDSALRKRLKQLTETPAQSNTGGASATAAKA